MTKIKHLAHDRDDFPSASQVKLLCSVSKITTSVLATL